MSFQKVLSTWVPILLEPIAARLGVRNAVNAFAEASGRQAAALALFRPPPEQGALPGAEAILLRPDRSPVPFDGRDMEVRDFDDWMVSPGSMKWRLLTGPSGRGKTRLMLRVVERLKAPGVHAGFLNIERLLQEPEALAGFAGIDGVKGDLFFVIDNAEIARAAVELVFNLSLLINKLAAEGHERRIRIVVIARGISEVWAEIERENPDGIGEVLAAGGLEHFDLEQVAATEEARVAEFDRAYAAFDDYFAWRSKGADRCPEPAARPDLAGKSNRDDYRDTVMIHLAALIVRIYKTDAADLSALEMIHKLVEREQAEWDRRIQAMDLPSSLKGDPIREAIAIATLVSITGYKLTKERLVMLLGLCPLLSRRPPDELSKVSMIIAALYPGPGYSVGLEPDVLGTFLLGGESLDFIGTVFANLNQTEVANGLTKLNWLAQSWLTYGERSNPEGARRIIAAIDANPTLVLPKIIDAAKESGDPIGLIASEWFRKNGNISLGRQLERLINIRYNTIPLREFALSIKLKIFESTDENNSLDHGIEKYTRAIYISILYSSIGEHNPALEMSSYAVDKIANLNNDFPGEFSKYYAASLKNHSTRLLNIGNRNESLESIKKCVDIWQNLANDGNKYNIIELASSLNSLARSLDSIGDSSKAIEKIKEAISMIDGIQFDNMDNILYNRAKYNQNLSFFYSNENNFFQSLEPIEKATMIFRNMFEDEPDLYVEDFVGALNDFGKSLFNLGKKDEAFELLNEAASILRPLAQRRPAVFLPYLGHILMGLTTVLPALGKHELVLSISEETVRGYKSLVKKNARAYRNKLAMSLLNLALELINHEGRKNYLNAIENAKEAADIFEKEEEKNPNAFALEVIQSKISIGIIYMKGKEYEKSLDEYKIILKKLPKHLLDNQPKFEPITKRCIEKYIEACKALSLDIDTNLLNPLHNLLDSDADKVGATRHLS